MRRLLVFVLYLIGTFFASLTTVSAATYYVAGDTGLDTNLGTSSAPWQTIQKAANTMVAGDTVNVKGGITYTGSNNCSILGAGEKAVACIFTNAGTSGNPITYQAWPETGTPIIDVSQAGAGVGSGFAIGKAYITVSGFEIIKVGTNGGNNPGGIYVAGGIYGITSNVIVKNNIIRDANRAIFVFSVGGSNMVLANNTIYRAVGDPTFQMRIGINVAAGSVVINNNIIVDTDTGLMYNGGSITADYNLYYDNDVNYSGIAAGTHDVTSDPFFTDPGNTTLSLQVTSPAINAGVDVTASGVTADILGRARPNAGAFDIGAYEDPNLYVAGDAGSDSYNGAMATPFLTIQKGADVATAGDNVNVKGGVTYNTVGSATCTLMAGERAVACIKTNSGTASNPITYQAWADTGTPIVDAASTNDGFGVLSSYIVIDGFEIKNGSNGNNPRAIMVSNPLGAQVSYLTIKNNIIHHNNYGGIEAFAADHLKIYNNTFDNHSLSAAIRVRPLTDIVDIKNNIITNNLTGIYSTASNVTADYNLLFGNTTAYNGLSAGTHDIALDPLYVASGSSDLRLQKSSPAINVGVVLSEITTDVLDVPRPQGAAYDIGAYEYYDVSISLTALSPDPTSDSTPTFAGTSSTPQGTISAVSYRADGGSWTSSGLTGTTSYSITLPSALDDGVHTVAVRATDSNGYTTDSTLYGTDSFTVDTVAPTSDTVSINAGDSTTADRDVTLTLSATDATSTVTNMMISESATFDSASWETYTTSKSHTLTTTNGLKTVYVKFKDAAGNESETYSATITLDTIKPTIRITDLGLIDDVPDKTPLFYYFTSQTPRIKGTTEALSTVHFTYEGNDYTTIANSSGNYEIDIPELPRQYVELNYYSIDPAGNQGTVRVLKLVIGVENFPAKLLPGEETAGTPSDEVTPTPIAKSGEETPTVIKVFGIQVTDQNGALLAETTVYINGQKYVTDKNGKIYIEKKPTSETKLEVEIKGQRVKGTVMGEKIVAQITSGPTTTQKRQFWFWIVLVAVLLLGGYGVAKLAEGVKPSK